LKISRIILIVIVVIVVGIVALFAYEAFVVPATTTTSSSVWLTAAQYPISLDGVYAVSGQQCLNSTSYIYCFGGQDYNQGPRSSVYISSSLSSASANITGWTSSSNSYPSVINGQSCVTYSSDVYCVGGTYDSGGDDIASSYYAPLSSSGVVGTWNATTAFPIAVDSQYCVASSSYIYCVAGNNETDGQNADAVATSSDWYAQLSTTGIGNWTQTNSYPPDVYFPDCVSNGGYIYCVGGLDSNDNALTATYYAPLSSSGIGSWTSTTAYPASLQGQNCVITSGNIYCVGGEGSSEGSFTSAVYYASVSSSGIGKWTQSKANYPDSAITDCAVSGSYVYCIGGADGSSNEETAGVYYASLSSLS
jgi:hypothetical protein